MKRYNRKKNIRWNTMKILVTGFLLVIVTGAVLLWLPVSNQKPIEFFDALFTSASAVCVTGLVTIIPQTQFTLFGKVILLILIQIGGLGIIACVTAFFFLLRRQITVRERMVIQETYNADSIGGIVGMVRRILIGTFTVEGVGALFYAVQFVPEYGLLRGIGYSIFHSVSAFCNAGFDLMGVNQPFSSLTGFNGNTTINLAIIALIVIGGIGFLTWDDIWHHRLHFHKYRLQSKVILTVTILLILLPALYFYFYEFGRTEWTDLSEKERILASAFQSVTPRTAGFNTVDLNRMSEPSQLIMILLMLIGGSPGSTAGGFKTTTLAVLFLTSFAVFFRKEDVQCFGRRIPSETVKNAATILFLYMSLFLLGGVVISCVDQVPLMGALFETSSAIGTVGLSLGLTPQLSLFSHMILILLMFWGRVGGLTLIFAVVSGHRFTKSKLPQEKITIG